MSTYWRVRMYLPQACVRACVRIVHASTTPGVEFLCVRFGLTIIAPRRNIIRQLSDAESKRCCALQTHKRRTGTGTSHPCGALYGPPMNGCARRALCTLTAAAKVTCIRSARRSTTTYIVVAVVVCYCFCARNLCAGIVLKLCCANSLKREITAQTQRNTQRRRIIKRFVYFLHGLANVDWAIFT